MTLKLLFSLLLSVSLSLAAAAEPKKIGTWYEDLKSPSYGDATLVIEREDDGRYFVVRRNGDGSGSRYRLERRGREYIKVGDKFGAKYVVTEKGLEIHDKAGYVRTAKSKER